MKNVLLPIYPMALMVCLSACQKEPGFNATSGNNTNITNCRISGEQNDENASNGNQFTITYDADRKVTGVKSALSGSPLATVTVASTEIIRTSGDGTETFDFTKDLFSGQPEAYDYTNTNTSYPARSASLTYNSKGKPAKVQNLDASDALVNTLDFTYDDNDNLTSVIMTAPVAGTVPLTFTSTGYGDKKSPFAGQTGAALLFYNWDYGSTDYTTLFNHLSAHNITGWSLTFTGGSETATYKYNTYNDNGYPTDVTESITNVSTGNPLQTTDIEWTYSYDCQ